MIYILRLKYLKCSYNTIIKKKYSTGKEMLASKHQSEG